MSDVERGWSLIELKRPAEAERVARDLLAREPSGVDAHRLLGCALDELGRSAEAEEVLRRGLALAPESDELLVTLAPVLSQLNKHDEARETALRAVHLAPLWWATHYTYAQVALGGRRPLVRDALAAAQRAVELAPNIAMAHNLLGLAWDAFNRPDQARESYQRALAIDPEHSTAMGNLAQLDSGTFRLKKAARGAAAAAALDPQSAHTREGVQLIAARLAWRATLIMIPAALLLLVMIKVEVGWPGRASVGVVMVVVATGLIHHSLGLLPSGLRSWRALFIDIEAQYGVRVIAAALAYAAVVVLAFAPDSLAQQAGVGLLRGTQVIVVIASIAAFAGRRKSAD